jgi:hypothetical protein
MRDVTERVLLAINSRRPKFFILGKLEFPGDTLFLSSLGFDVTFAGDLYPKGSPVISFGPPRASSSVDRQIYELVVSDTEGVVKDKLRTSVVGSLLSVYISFFDATTGEPILDEEDVLLAYQGALDSGAVVVNTDNKVAKLMAASPMGKLDAIGAYMVSKDGMAQINAADTSFNEVIAGSKEVNFKWGKR